MPSQSRPQSLAVARRWLVTLLAAWPALAFAQSSPAISTVVAFSGSQPASAPVRGPDGALYGVTSIVNLVAGGLVYRLQPNGSGIETHLIVSRAARSPSLNLESGF